MPATFPDPFDPLAPENIGVTLALELLDQPLQPFPPSAPRGGAGVYALYYSGEHPAYARLREIDAARGLSTPVYIGKALRENAKKGFRATPTSKRKLAGRLRAHARSIRQTDLKLEDIGCRYLVLNDAYISLAESVLITVFRPPWNGMGLGNNGTGGIRMKGQASPWDSLHPGRKGRPAGSVGSAAEAQALVAAAIDSLAEPLDDRTARMVEKIRARSRHTEA